MVSRSEVEIEGFEGAVSRSPEMMLSGGELPLHHASEVWVPQHSDNARSLEEARKSARKAALAAAAAAADADAEDFASMAKKLRHIARNLVSLGA